MNKNPESTINLEDFFFMPIVNRTRQGNIIKDVSMKPTAVISLSTTKWTLHVKNREATNAAVLSPFVICLTKTYMSIEATRYRRNSVIISERYRLRPSAWKIVIKKYKGSRILGEYTEGIPKSISSHKKKTLLVKASGFNGGLKSPLITMRGYSNQFITRKLNRKNRMTNSISTCFKHSFSLSLSSLVGITTVHLENDPSAGPHPVQTFSRLPFRFI